MTRGQVFKYVYKPGPYGTQTYIFQKMDGPDILASSREQQHQIMRFTPEQQKKIEVTNEFEKLRARVESQSRDEIDLLFEAVPVPDVIAREFSKLLARDLGPDKMAQVIRRNKRAEPGICHSHDFCDANMVMAEAFKHFGISEDEILDHANNDHLTALWNSAWDLAKTSNFFVGQIKEDEEEHGIPAYFDHFTLELPNGAIADCSGAGSNDEAVAYWEPRVDRPSDATPEAIVNELKNYGAWSPEQLADDDANWLRIIWVAAHNIKEEQRDKRSRYGNPPRVNPGEYGSADY